MQHRAKIAVFHSDPKISDRIVHFAADVGLEAVQPASRTELNTCLNDTRVVAVVLDIAPPNKGGFELLERIGHSPSSPLAILVTDLDAKTTDSIRRVAEAKALKVAIFKKGRSQALNACLRSLMPPNAGFGARELDEAIDRKYLRVEYQPKVPFDPKASRAYGVEALSRLSHPDFGEIRPEEFVAVAEKEGLIAKFTDAVVCQAFRDWQSWSDQGLTLRLAVNVSPALLGSSEWPELFLRRCSEFKIDTSWITLEITESASGASTAEALEILTRLRLRGVTLSIDDFGTGFSSLATLYKLPFGELKIDKNFTLDMEESSEARTLIETTVEMARRLGLKVTAEGVESEAVFQELRRMGCHDAQGHFISKSMPASEVPQFFSDWIALMEREPVEGDSDSVRPKIAVIQSMLNGILEKHEPNSAGAPVNGEAVSVMELAGKLPALALQDRPMAALKNCHAAGRRLEKHQERVALKSKISELRRLLEHELVCRDDIQLVTPTGTVRLLPRHSALIGRPSPGKPVDIAVGCRWLSRGEKSLRLFSEGLQWFVEDLGSTNGASIGEQTLPAGQPFAIPIGDTFIAIGQAAGTPAPVTIRLRRPETSPNAVVVTFIADSARLENMAPETPWPSFKEDLRTTWIVFQEELTVGASKQCAIVLGDTTADIAAEIRFQDGFWIKPRENAELIVGDTKFDEAVPLLVAANASIAGASVRVEHTEARVPSLRRDNQTPLRSLSN